MVNLSVIVCCYNSEHLLEETLSHLANQVINKKISYEVVLVDNNSTDQTANVAKDLWIELDSPAVLNVIVESQPGLSYARKTGVLASKGDLIIFCDDDNWLQKDYLQTAFDFMMANPRVGALGGQSEGVLEICEPNWWQNEKTNYAVGKQAEISGDISERGYVWGAGLALRKDMMMKLYCADFRSLLTGRKGKKLASGDDSEICKWVLLLGYKLWFLEALKFKHYITKNRLSDKYLTKLLEGHSESQKVLNLYNWYLRNGVIFIQQKSKFLVLKRSVKLIIKGFLWNKHKWREKLQLELGLRIKVHPIIFKINKTYLLIKS